jgi:hypothetical protein
VKGRGFSSTLSVPSFFGADELWGKGTRTLFLFREREESRRGVVMAHELVSGAERRGHYGSAGRGQGATGRWQ